MLEDFVEHLPGAPPQLAHERTEIAVEVAEEEQRTVAQHRET